ncbi:MAG: mannose-1-phosphate guanylyltransferase/mannose-6-phosphate isomerase [Candidatus Omnitrophica bacterium]|nr:mannose-1-phosphate guanylyltransferase/mannose-6-phosphate isomerase [Candidatus Omnitrophota bacterium]MDD5352461.1 mannose-1-phosphate guanylyltransferase/mannose-6-phosphate isomerase [Candidatus Omnitrophota bacterium]MDD5550059.1 mannose-1-phosphate guanylyltransferase/mannose-6-phosphate isomerase [Candidatus Omnitrophota bacterium]
MNYAVILAGGKGIRFWPLSRQEEPKQLLKIFGNYSLLQHTYLRISKIIPARNVYVVTNKDYDEAIRYQLKELGFCLDNIIVEISPKNTAASIGLVAKIIQEKDPDGVMAVFPADHFIKKENVFSAILKKSFALAKLNTMLIFGIKPLRAESAYGYIKINKKVSPLKRIAFKVEKFIEKPKLGLAENLIKQGTVYWNGGIFIWKASVLLEKIKKFMPRLYSVLGEKNKKSLTRKWNALDSVSIDYGIMEKCKDSLYVAPLDCGWTDLGNWNTIDFVLNRDKNKNAIYGDVLTLNTKNTTVWGGHHLVVAMGLKDMIIADTPDALLVCPKEQAQRVSEVVDILKARKRFEYMTPRLVNRPWGRYFVLNDTGRFKTKMVEVEPHRRLSLQLHQRRAEHWIVVEGIAKVTIGNKTYFVKSNESIYVPRGQRHRIENNENHKLTFIEVQTGSYLGEDDIERFEDDFERLKSHKNKN